MTAPVSLLVTGGSGFLGSHVVRAAREAHPDWRITVLDLTIPTQAATTSNPVTYLQGSITSSDDVDRALSVSRPTAIVHCAGFVPPPESRHDRRLEHVAHTVNVEGTRTMLDACHAYRQHTVQTAGHGSQQLRAFVYTSSCTAVIENLKHEYRNIDERWPTSPRDSLIYGETKAQAEALVLAANAPNRGQGPPQQQGAFYTCALRPSVLIGEDDHQFIPSIHALIARYQTCFVLGTGQNLWDLTYITNAADAHLLAVENLLGLQSSTTAGAAGTVEVDSGAAAAAATSADMAMASTSPPAALVPSAAGQALFIQNNEPVPFRDLCLAVWREFEHYPAFAVVIPERLAWFVGAAMEALTYLLARVALLWSLLAGIVPAALSSRTATGAQSSTRGMGGSTRGTGEAGQRPLAAISRGSVRDACAWRYASGHRAQEVLGYVPRVSLEEGIRRCCAAYRLRLAAASAVSARTAAASRTAVASRDGVSVDKTDGGIVDKANGMGADKKG